MAPGRKYTTSERAEVRIRAGRKVEPSAAIADTQSVKTTGQATEVGFDGGKMILGRKRHIVVDTLGLLLGVFVHAAGRSDQAGFKLLLQWFADFWPRLQLLWVDSSYRGSAFIEWVQQTTGLILQPVKRPQGQKGFEVLPRRWVVERTFSWFNHYRRLSKDYEFLPTKARDDDLRSHDSFDVEEVDSESASCLKPFSLFKHVLRMPNRFEQD